MKIKIAIADDHPLVINGLHHILNNSPDMEVTGSYLDGIEILDGLATSVPDVLLLDIQMPGKTGDEVAEIINVQYPQVKMIALTNQDNLFYIKNMMRKGVLGYILKTSREEILLEGIRTVHRGEEYIEPILKERLLQDALHDRKQMPEKPLLSRRESDVLKFIAQSLTSQEIAEKLFLSKRTVDNHRTSLLMKLDAKNVAAMIKKGTELGLI